MRLRDQIKDLIKKQLPVNTDGSKYVLSTAIQQNDDELKTWQCEFQGNIISATPLYPLTKGQEVILVFGDSGSVSAIPTRPATPSQDLIIPPFFSGGKFRFLSQTFALDPANINTQLKLQDSGSSNVYILDLGRSVSLLQNPVLSPNGEWLAYVEILPGTGNTSYEIHSINIGKKLVAVGDPVDKDLKLFNLKFTEKFAKLMPFQKQFADPGVNGTGILFSNYNVLDLFVDNKGVLYWMDIQTDIWSLAYIPINPPNDGSIQALMAGVLNCYNYDGTTFNTTLQLTLFSTNAVFSTPLGTTTRIDITYTSLCPVPLGFADPLQNLIFAAGPSGVGVIFSGISRNGSIQNGSRILQSDLDTPSTVQGTYTLNAVPVVMNFAGTILKTGLGIFGHSTSPNHTAPHAIGQEVINSLPLGGGGGGPIINAPLQYLPSRISNWHRLSATTTDFVWWIDDQTLGLFGFRMSKDKDKNPVVANITIVNSISDLSMDANMPDFRNFTANFLPYNIMLIDKRPAWIECGGSESSHTFNPESHRHVRKLSLKMDDAGLNGVVTINGDNAHMSGISPNDPGGYPAGGIAGILLPVQPDPTEWRILYDPQDPDVGLNEFLFWVSAIS